LGFTPQDIAWTEAALSRHFGCPVKLHDPAEFAELERRNKPASSEP
jgi:hypothetical protein